MVAERFRARERRESLSLQHVDKERRAAGFKCLPLSFFFPLQSLGGFHRLDGRFPRPRTARLTFLG